MTVNPGTLSESVSWDEPTATDASGIASITSTPPSGTSFLADTTTTVVYNAVDNARNKDRSCQFTVSIVTNGGKFYAQYDNFRRYLRTT